MLENENNENFTENEDRKLASVEKIDKIKPIPNADSIEVACVKGWEVVVKKGEFIEGDWCIYVEIDSILPQLEVFEFMKPRNYKVKTIKLRGQISQGMCFPLTVKFIDNFPNCKPIKVEVGTDVTESLGIKKYIPVQKSIPAIAKGSFPSDFLFKTDEVRFQNVFSDLNDLLRSDTYSITEKLDGSSLTVYLKDDKFGVCSRNLELKESESPFWRVVRDYKIEEILNKYKEATGYNMCLQGELVGEGIQGNKYNIKGNDLYIFNVFNIDTQEYMTTKDVVKFCNLHNLKHVPIIDSDYVFYEFTKEAFEKISKIKSTLNSNVLAEGVVIRSGSVPIRMNDVDRLEGIRGFSNNRFSFKIINPEWLLKYDN